MISPFLISDQKEIESEQKDKQNQVEQVIDDLINEQQSQQDNSDNQTMLNQQKKDKKKDKYKNPPNTTDQQTQKKSYIENDQEGNLSQSPISKFLQNRSRDMSPSNINPYQMEEKRMNKNKINKQKLKIGYYQRQKNGQPSFSFGLQQKTSVFEDHRNMSPGPAAYDNRKSPNLSQIKKTAKIYMGCEERKGFTDEQNVRNGNPGPGQYKVRDQMDDLGKKAQTFGQAIRDQDMVQKSSQLIPGPGKYDPSFRITQKSTTQTSLKGKTKESYFDEQNKHNFVPGPGQYNPKDRFELGHINHQGDQMSKEKKGLRFDTNQKVGPGTYKIDKQNQASFTFNQEKRPQLFKLDQNPGPGEYSLETNGLNYVRPYS